MIFLIVKVFILLITITTGIVSLRRNSDLFSPVKIYLVISTYFFLGIYIRDVRWETLLCYAFLIISIFACAYIEQPHAPQGPVKIQIPFKKLHVLIWIYSLPAYVIIFYLVGRAGGVEEYLPTLGMRVVEWRGKGLMLVLLNILPALSLVYYASLLTNAQTTSAHRTLFLLHFVLFVAVGVLTASRSYIAFTILGMLAVRGYLFRSLSFRCLIAVGALLFLLVGILGSIRNLYSPQFRFDQIEWMSVVRSFETAQMSYGIDQLEVILSAPERPPLYGQTYLTLLTNVAPRALFPNKPDTAGIVFTHVYLGQWGGLSHVSTGAVTEAIMNFGKSAGIPIGIALNFLVLASGCVLYNKVFSGISFRGHLFTLIHIPLVFYASLTLARFSYGEFTDIFQSFIFNNALPLYMLRYGMVGRSPLRKHPSLP